MLTTSKGRGSPLASCGSSRRCACVSVASRDPRVATVFLDAALEHTPLASRSSTASNHSPLDRPSAFALSASVVFEHLGIPGQHLGIGIEPGANARRRPHSHRARGRSSPRTWRSVTGSTAPAPSRRRCRRRGGTGDRRRIAGGDSRAETRQLAKPTGRGVVLQAGGRHHAVSARSRPAASGSDGLDLLALVVLVELRRDRRAAAGRIAASPARRARQRRREAHREQPDRQAGRAGTLALAGKLCREGRARVEVETLLDARQHQGWPAPRCRGPTESARVGRQRALATRQQRRIRRLLRNAARLQHRASRSAPPLRSPAADARRCPRPRTRRWPARSPA